MRKRKVPETWKSRKFIIALLCLALATLCVVYFVQNVAQSNATLLLTVVAAPCLLIVGGIAGVQGAHDIKYGEKGLLTLTSSSGPANDDDDPTKVKRDAGGGK